MRFLKRKYIIILAVALLFIVPLSLLLLSSPKSKQSPKVPPTPSDPNSQISPGSGFSPSLYDNNAEERLLEKIENRQQLSISDNAAKNKILALLPANTQSGILFQSQTIVIDYVAGPNVFQVEILTTDVERAKAEGANWFRSQGLSQEGICNYPVEFYLNFDVKNELRESNPDIQFNPLADGC